MSERDPEAMPAASEASGGSAAVWLLCGLIALPIVAYGQLFVETAVNAPYLDDYDIILDFLNRFVVESSGLGRLEMLFSQHMEHRLGVVRLAALGVYGSLGGVDFRVLNGLGSAALLALLFALYAASRCDGSRARRLWLFAPVPFVLVHPQYWDTLQWSTSSLSNFTVVTFALLALVSLGSDSPTKLAAAIAAAVAACFAQANGLLVWPCGLALLLAARRRRAAAIWSCCGGLLIALYFWGYQSPGLNPPLWEAAGQVSRNALYVVYFAGSAPGFGSAPLSALAGVGLVASFVALTGLRHWQRQPALYGILAFLFASAVANAIGRGHIVGAVYPLESPRYQFFSLALLAPTYLCWASRTSAPRASRRLAPACLVAAIALCLASHMLYRDDVERLSARLERGLASWSRGTGGLAYPRPRISTRILNTSLELGTFRMPEAQRVREITPP